MDKEVAKKCMLIKGAMVGVAIILYFLFIFMISSAVFKQYNTNKDLYGDCPMITTEAEFITALDASSGENYFCEVAITSLKDAREYYDSTHNIMTDGLCEAFEGDYAYLRFTYEKLTAKQRTVTDDDGNKKTETYYEWETNNNVVYRSEELDIYGVSTSFAELGSLKGVEQLAITDSMFGSKIVSIKENYIYLDNNLTRVSVFVCPIEFNASMDIKFIDGDIQNENYIYVNATNQQLLDELLDSPAILFWFFVLLGFILIGSLGAYFIVKFKNYKIAKLFKLVTNENPSLDAEANAGSFADSVEYIGDENIDGNDSSDGNNEGG